MAFGGAERVMAILCNRLVENNGDIYLVTDEKKRKEYKLDSRIKRIYVGYIGNGGFIRRNINMILSLRKIIRDVEPSVVCSFMMESNVRNVIASFGTRAKTCIAVRTSPDREIDNRIIRIIGHFICGLADVIVFQTETACRMYPRHTRNKSCVIPNPVSDVFFEKPKCPKPIGKHIIAVGRLTAEKNFTRMIEIFEIVQKAVPDAVLSIWGEGYEREKLEKAISEKHLENKVILKGTTSCIKNEYDKNDIYILTSDFEGMPNTILEAMACGLPVVAADCPCGGVREIIENDMNGFLVDPADKMCFATKVLLLLSDVETYDRIAYEGRRTVERYREEQVSLQWRTVLWGIY